MRSSAFHFGKVCGKQEYPPPPHASESLDWHGFCKNALQNLEPREVRDQNLDCKSLSGISRRVLPAACALEMIYFFSGARKVRRHIVSVDNLRELFIDFFPDRLVRITNSPVFSSRKIIRPTSRIIWSVRFRETPSVLAVSYAVTG
jgi:hypothetical protein